VKLEYEEIRAAVELLSRYRPEQQAVAIEVNPELKNE
jgi:hypothetical protein